MSKYYIRFFSTENAFDFESSCLFCGDTAEIIFDKKHPARSNKSEIVFCNTRNKGNNNTFKESLLKVWY